MKHRLDTAGELRQISFFKELARKKKQQLTQQINFLTTRKNKANKQKAIQMINFIVSEKKKANKQKQQRIRFI